MEHSFYMPISALPGLFSRLVQVPLYRQPNTLGWAGLDSQLPAISRTKEETPDFSPLSALLHFLPHFLPDLVKPLIQHYLFDDQLRYGPACFDYLQSNGFLPGTSSEAMERTYNIGPLPGLSPLTHLVSKKLLSYSPTLSPLLAICSAL